MRICLKMTVDETVNTQFHRMGFPQFNYQQYDENQSQPTFRGLRQSVCKRRFVLMAGITGVVIIISTVIIAVISLNYKEEIEEICSKELQCLPINLCDFQINADINFPCGDREKNKICCKPKQITRTAVDSNEVIEKRERKKEKMKKCGVMDVLDKTANGENATLGQLPWMAILGYKDRITPFTSYKCGGTLIHNRYILTAAHCTNIADVTLTTATLGIVNLQNIERGIECEYDGTVCSVAATIGIEKIITHPNYNRVTYKNDIALLRLEKDVSVFNNSDFIKPICLPFGIKVEEYLNHKNYSISGWGRTHLVRGTISDVLQVAYNIQPWDYDKCNDKITNRKILPISTTQICAASNTFAEACRGDSGGPLMYDVRKNINIYSTQFGIISFKLEDSCGTTLQPAIFTRVDQYLNWILDNMDI